MNKNKGETMNNLKKLGLSALAGSLVAVSAQAGEMAVTGSANVTYKTGNDNTGGNLSSKSIGTDKDVAFTGSGELDNGWTFSVSTLLTDAFGVSSSMTSITMGSLGTIAAGADFGSAHYKYDEEVPQAYEQTSDGQQNSANIVGNMMDNNNIVYYSPSFDLGSGVTASFDAGYSWQATDAVVNDGGTAAYDAEKGSAMELGVTVKYDALQIGVYGAERENTIPDGSTAGDTESDAFEGVWYAKYSFGPVSVGYSQSYLDSGVQGVSTAANVTKAVRTAVGVFESETMGIAFNVNDDLSISWTETEDTYDAQSDQTANIADVKQTTDAFQIAYSMGAMSIKAYKMDTDNPSYDEDRDSESVTEIALGLSF